MYSLPSRTSISCPGTPGGGGGEVGERYLALALRPACPRPSASGLVVSASNCHPDLFLFIKRISTFSSYLLLDPKLTLTGNAS
jgi:hypothetical protein